MKVLCVIDSFGSGGAQRQMVNLALGLKARGHEVEFFVYFPKLNFFRSIVDNAGIPVHEVDKGHGGFSFTVLVALIRLIRRSDYDVVISFLNSPNVYAELAKLAAWNTPIIVSERSSHKGDKSRVGPFLKRVLHAVADKVVANSHSHADWLRNIFWLRRKTSVIYNGIDIGVPGEMGFYENISDLKVLVVGRVGPEKNALNIIKALAILHDRHGHTPKVQWAGRRDNRPAGVAYCRQIDNLLDTLPHITANWEWLGERADVPQLLLDHHLLVHASFYEGLPNAVCEALAAGRIVLVSNVCDHPRLVEDGERGFLFDPHSPEDIANAIERAARLSRDEAQRISAYAREFAQSRLSHSVMVNEYEQLLRSFVVPSHR